MEIDSQAGSTARPPLRPMGLGEILDAAFKIYRAHFKELALCVLVVAVPLAILGVLVQASSTENAFDPTPSPEAQASLDAAAVAGFVVAGLLSGLGTLLATAACTRAVAAAYLGERVSWRESVRYAGRKLLPLIGLGILVSLASFLGLLVLLVGAVFVFVRLLVSTPALLVEDIGVGASIRRSWKLVGGRWWVTFGTFVVVILIAFVLSAVLQLLFLAPLLGGASDSELLGGILTGLASIVTNVVTLPLQAGVIALLYFDLRVRKEGFDLELLAQRMGGSGGGTAPPPSGLGDDTRPSDTYGGFSPPSSEPPRP